MTLYGGLALNTGSYFGSGYSYTGVSGTKNASSVNQTRIIRDLTTGYSSDIEAIETYLEMGETTRALELYNDLLDEASESASNYGYTLSQGQKKSIVDNAFKSATGTSISKALTENADNSFMTGFNQGFNWCTDNTVSKKEALAEVNGTSVSLSDRLTECVGALAGGTVSGGLLGAAVGGIAVAAGASAFLPFVLGGIAASWVISTVKTVAGNISQDNANKQA